MRVPALAKFNWSADGNLPLDVRFFNEVLSNGSKAGMVCDACHLNVCP